MTDLKTLLRGWNNFWFRPESAVPIAVFRILFGLLVLQFAWFMTGELHSMLGQRAIVSQAANDAFMGSPRINLLAWLVHSDGALDIFWAVFILAAICLTLGFCTRLSAVIVYLVLISCEARNYFIFTGADNLMRVESFLLIFSQCGAALSVDSLLKIWLKKNPDFGPAEPVSPWALRLLQVQVSLCYWAAYASKICGNTWIDGSAVYYVTHIVEENKYKMPYLYDHLWTCRLLSWSALVMEFSLAVLIWFKELRLPLILLGILFHMSLDFTLIIPQFQTIMIISLISFIEPPTYSKAIAWLRVRARKLAGAPLLAIYDQQLDLSARLAETVRRLDILHLVNLVEARQAADAASKRDPSSIIGQAGIFVPSSGDRDWTGNRQALLEISRRLPALIVVCPFLYLPGCSLIVSATSAMLRRLYPDRASAEPEAAV